LAGQKTSHVFPVLNAKVQIMQIQDRKLGGGDSGPCL